MVTTPGTYRTADGARVLMTTAKSIWFPLAREGLLSVAQDYNALVTYKELAEVVQERSGIRTRQQLNYWIGSVLGSVADDCYSKNEPLLSSLCVHQDGTIGEGYAVALRRTYMINDSTDLEMLAAEERLRCYAYFGATLPPGGGRPTLPSQIGATRERERKRASRSTVTESCPKCHIALPGSGRCDQCD